MELLAGIAVGFAVLVGGVLLFPGAIRALESDPDATIADMLILVQILALVVASVGWTVVPLGKRLRPERYRNTDPRSISLTMAVPLAFCTAIACVGFLACGEYLDGLKQFGMLVFVIGSSWLSARGLREQYPDGDSAGPSRPEGP